MSGFFSWPLGLLGLLAVPVLVGIYLLRNRFRTHFVSSLMLWQDQRKPRQGGLNISKIQTPLLFALELLAIVTLVLSAAGPLLRAKSETRVLVVVLDDSFSMLAGEPSARDKAVEAITKLLKESGDFQVRFLTAGARPELLGEPIDNLAQAAAVLGNWRCNSVRADLGSAITLAAELAGKTGRVLAITDHRPENPIEAGRVEWWGFGERLDNVGIVSASRTRAGESQRCFAAVANFSRKAATRAVTVSDYEGSRILLKKDLDIDAGGINRMFFEPDANAGPIRVTFDGDSLAADDEVILAEEPLKRLRVAVRIGDGELERIVRRALDAAGGNAGASASTDADILITDSNVPEVGNSQMWTLRIVSDANASAYVGPFVVDHSHPLTRGIGLNSVIWAAGRKSEMTTVPVIAAGNVPLVTERTRADEMHEITMYLNPEISNLARSPDWPIFFYNLLEWRRSELDGLASHNYVSDSQVVVRVSEPEPVNITAPDGQQSRITPQRREVFIRAEEPGVYSVETPTADYIFTVNAMSMAESDLRKAETGRWGQWQQASLYWWEYRPIDWLLLLVGLAALSVHRILTARGEGTRI